MAYEEIINENKPANTAGLFFLFLKLNLGALKRLILGE
nr:MAG TPA: hypothetical protein [Caudoviricetes sp.]